MEPLARYFSTCCLGTLYSLWAPRRGDPLRIATFYSVLLWRVISWIMTLRGILPVKAECLELFLWMLKPLCIACWPVLPCKLLGSAGRALWLRNRSTARSGLIPSAPAVVGLSVVSGPVALILCIFWRCDCIVQRFVCLIGTYLSCAWQHYSISGAQMRWLLWMCGRCGCAVALVGGPCWWPCGCAVLANQ